MSVESYDECLGRPKDPHEESPEELSDTSSKESLMGPVRNLSGLSDESLWNPLKHHLRTLCGAIEESLRTSIEDWGIAGTVCGIL